MAGLTDRDLRRIKRFVETPPTKRTPQQLMPDGDERAETQTETETEKGTSESSTAPGRSGTDHEGGEGPGMVSG